MNDDKNLAILCLTVIALAIIIVTKRTEHLDVIFGGISGMAIGKQMGGKK